MTKAVFGLATSEEQARRIIDELLSEGFVNEDISLLYPNQNEEQEEDTYTRRDIKKDKGNLSTERHSKAPEGGATGATAGGILGGSLGLLAGIGALSIPGIGPFIAAGPIMAALSGSAVGGSLGLLLGSLIGYGIPEYEAKKYEAGLREGNILISVHTDNNEELKRAAEIMKSEGARDISSTSEKAQSKY